MATASRKSRAEEVSWEGVPQELFDALRNWRRELAARKSVPPYTIFHDSTLRDISRVRPTTLEGLRSISGVGDAKLREYGTEVVEMVVRLSREHGLSTDTGVHGVPATSSPRPVTEGAGNAFPLFRAGKSVAEVAQLLDRTESTVREYLCVYIQEEQPPSIDSWVERSAQERITAAVRQHGAQRLKPIYLALNEQVPYDAIRIVLSHLSARSRVSARVDSRFESVDT